MAHICNMGVVGTLQQEVKVLIATLCILATAILFVIMAPMVFSLMEDLTKMVIIGMKLPQGMHLVTAVVLLTLPSPVRPALPYVLAGVACVAGCAALVVRGAARRGRSRLTCTARAVSDDLRRGLLAPDVWPQLTLASVLVVAGHTATFVIAARVAGCTAPLGELVALLMVVQTSGVIPLSIGGWGLREGAAAWAFAAAGLGAATGVTLATLYAVLMLAAVAPGAGLLLGDAVRRRRGPGQPGEPGQPDPVAKPLEAVRG